MASEDWKRLVEALDNWGSATEIEPGQIEVAMPGGAGRRVVVVMTPDQGEDLAGVMWGGFDDALDDVKQTLLELGPEERFAVYSQYRLVASTAPRLPDPPLRTPEPGGRWVAYDRQGRVTSRLADWPESDGAG